MNEFAALDTENNRKIKWDDLVPLLGRKCATEQIKPLLIKSGILKDGYVKYESFIKWLYASEQPPSPDHEPPQSSQARRGPGLCFEGVAGFSNDADMLKAMVDLDTAYKAAKEEDKKFMVNGAGHNKEEVQGKPDEGTTQDKESGDRRKSAPPAWSIGEYLGPALGAIVSEALVSLLPPCATVDRNQIALVKALGRAGSTKIIKRVLESQHILEKLANQIMKCSEGIAKQEVATSEQLSDKFKEDGAFELAYGTKADFFAGLEPRIGAPKPNILDAMVREHCHGPDAERPWTTGNYGITTTSKKEFLLVAHEVVDKVLTNTDKYPEAWHAVANELSKLGEELGWPTEWPQDTTNADHPRAAERSQDFLDTLMQNNTRLKEAREKEVLLEEALALRLYTGPLFEKYNSVNRGGALDGKSNARMKSRFKELCGAGGSEEPEELNRYATTIFVITSGLIKTSKLSKAETVWRGTSGGVLPEQFWNEDDSGVKGGIEFGFLSTTTNREVAFGYASNAGAVL